MAVLKVVCNAATISHCKKRPQGALKWRLWVLPEQKTHLVDTGPNMFNNIANGGQAAISSVFLLLSTNYANLVESQTLSPLGIFCSYLQEQCSIYY